MAYDLRLLYPAAGRIMVSHNAGYIDPPTTVPEEKRPNRRLRVGLISNLDREKGLDLAIETVEAALAAGTDLELWLAGPFSSETARHRFDAAKVRLGDRLDWLGPVAGARKHDFFQSIDVLLFPTQYRYEAQPLVVLEAMAFGLPVVTTDRGYIEELVGKGFALSPDPSRFVPAASVRLAQLAGREDVGSATRQRYDALRRVALAQRTALLDILYADRAAMSAHAPAPALNEPG
jgi:glycosyltransferase involved in cell wall biosynthesis